MIITWKNLIKYLCNIMTNLIKNNVIFIGLIYKKEGMCYCLKDTLF